LGIILLLYVNNGVISLYFNCSGVFECSLPTDYQIFQVVSSVSTTCDLYS